MEYNIWHIEMYVGWSDCDGPEDCNIKRDYIFDASFSKQDVINMITSKYNKERCLEIWKCILIDGNHKLCLEGSQYEK